MSEGVLGTVEGFIAPGMLHWRRQMEYEKARTLVLPALDKGPKPGSVRIDLDAGTATFEAADPAEK
jgi:hypothetical protein